MKDGQPSLPGMPPPTGVHSIPGRQYKKGLSCIIPLNHSNQKRSLHVSHLIVKTYEEASRAVEQLGILPLSSFIPAHSSLDSITEPGAWHTGADTDPWHWRDRFASEGSAAYGRFIGSRPILIARGVFPLVKCLLASPPTVKERYTAGLLARATLQLHQIIHANHGIEVRALRKLAGMQEKADKHASDHPLVDLHNNPDIVISGVAENLNDQGHQSSGD